jgi:hypothetical protein
MRGRVCRIQLLLVLTNTVILGSESLGTRDHILLSQIPDFSFRRFLRFAGLLWKYLTSQKQKQKLTAGNQPARSHLASGPAGNHGHIFVQCQGLFYFKVKITLRLTVSQSVSLGVEPHLGLMTRYVFINV